MAKSSRSDYCQEQATACGTKATATAIADIKEAYLNLEQAWRQLIPDFDAETSPQSKGHPDTSKRRVKR